MSCLAHAAASDLVSVTSAPLLAEYAGWPGSREARRRTDHHDARSFGLGELRAERRAQRHDAVEVHVDDVPERVDVVLGATVGDGADAGHEHIERVERCGEFLCGAGVGDIELMERESIQVAAGILGGARPCSRDVNLGTCEFESPRRAQPDTAAATHDEDDASGEVDHDRRVSRRRGPAGCSRSWWR